MTPHDAALAYARKNWLVLPIKPGLKGPATKNGYLDATTDAARIRKWWSRQGSEERNIGIVTSPTSGIWVLDCDVDKVTGQPIGEATLAHLIAKNGPLPPHPIARTPHGGRHHVFAWPTDGDLPRTIGFLPGLDALGSRKDEEGNDAGGYFLVWPSKTAVGAYTWEVAPKDVGFIPPAPQWLVDIIRSKASKRPPDLPRIKPVRAEKTNAYGRAALTEICDEVAACLPGSQDDTLYRKAVRIGSIAANGDIDEHEAFTSLVDAGMRMMNGDAGRPWTQREVADKVRRGMAFGSRDPYKPRPLDPKQPDRPLPLFPPLPAQAPYPIDALGPVLSPAAAAIARKVQVPTPIAAQSVLATALLAAQAHANVKLPYGQTRPLSLFFVTVADSGDRKTTADTEALGPVRTRERELRELHQVLHRQWSIDHAAWAAQKRKIENNGKTSVEEKREKLTALGPEPPRPLHPFLTAPDPTIEGLFKAWVWAPAALGLFSSEGGQFIGGYGMSDDNRLKTAAALSSLWDGEPVKRLRAGDGVTSLYGRRLSLHIMVQPTAAPQLLADPLLRGQGLLSRLLVAAPDSLAGTRLYRPTEPEDDAAIREYGASILSVLERQWPLADGTMNELAPPVLTLSAEAEAAWRKFFDHVEEQCAVGEELRPLKDFAAKAAEHAARIAGVLTVVEDPRATQITGMTMKNAVALADWYVGEAVRLHGAGLLDTRLVRAQQLLEWLRERHAQRTSVDAPATSVREILQYGPAPLRRKAAADDALKVLGEHGWVEVSGRPRRVRLLPDEGSA